METTAMTTVTTGPNDSLPALPSWQSRSFWVVAGAAAVSVSSMTGINLLGFIGASDVNSAVDKVLPIVTLVAPAAVWFLRRAPNFRLTAGEKTPVRTVTR